MKILIKFFEILGLAIFFLICWPVLLWRRIRNKRWRQNMKVGDWCYYINALNRRSYCTVEDVITTRTYVGEDPPTTKRALVRVEGPDYSTMQWLNAAQLKKV